MNETVTTVLVSEKWDRLTNKTTVTLKYDQRLNSEQIFELSNKVGIVIKTIPSLEFTQTNVSDSSWYASIPEGKQNFIVIDIKPNAVIVRSIFHGSWDDDDTNIEISNIVHKIKPEIISFVSTLS